MTKVTHADVQLSELDGLFEFQLFCNYTLCLHDLAGVWSELVH